MQIVNPTLHSHSVKETWVQHKWQHVVSSFNINPHCSRFSSELIGSLSCVASIMAGHDVPPADASELHPVVNLVLTPFQHIDEHPVVTLGDLEAALNAPPVMPLENGDPELMIELDAQLISEAETYKLFDLDLPELLPPSHGRPAPMDAPPQPIQAAASVCDNVGGGVEETRIDTPSCSAIPRRRTQSRVHRRPAAERPSPLTAGGEGSRGGSGLRTPRRASSSSCSSTGSSSPRADPSSSSSDGTSKHSRGCNLSELCDKDVNTKIGVPSLL